MSNVALPVEHAHELAHESHGHGDHGHGEHGHDHGPLHHHFTDMAQQRESNALGMWGFLITEVMTFGALFFVYTLYRHLFEVASHQAGPMWASPFAAGSHMLNNPLGFTNTLVLLVSSLTMASAVHHAAMRNRKYLVMMLCITWVLGLTFLGIKSVEWTADWREGIVPGLHWNPKEVLAHHGYVLANEDGVNGQAWSPITGDTQVKEALADAQKEAGWAETPEAKPHPLVNGMHMQMFFCIYFCMTGLHAIHMIIGLGLVGMYIKHAKNGIFDVKGNDQPVEILGLYWHFVDIVWVFLYPLLYLIAH